MCHDSRAAGGVRPLVSQARCIWYALSVLLQPVPHELYRPTVQRPIYLTSHKALPRHSTAALTRSISSLKSGAYSYT